MSIESEKTSSHFLLMGQHGEGIRAGTPGGTVVLSRLPGGRSKIAAHASCIKFVLQGEEVYSIAGRTHRVRPGEFILVESETDFDVQTSRTDESIGLCIYLGTDRAFGPPRETDLAAPVIGGSRIDPFAALLATYAGRLARDSADGASLAARLMRDAGEGSQVFLSRFARAHRQLSQARPATRTEILQRLERARAFIHDQADRVLTLDEIAREASLSRFHLVHAFGEAYGQTPIAYHRSVRLQAAAEKLRLRTASATELSGQLGYGSPSAFTRAFKTEFGVAPRVFAANA